MERENLTPAAVHDPNARWISVAEAARFLQLSEAQVRSRVASGEIHSSGFFGRTALLEESVKAYRERATR
jgi:Helix-turn-helix domain